MGSMPSIDSVLEQSANNRTKRFFGLNIKIGTTKCKLILCYETIIWQDFGVRNLYHGRKIF
jgi:hypothetical protein